MGLVGNSNVGKTSLIRRFAIGDEFDDVLGTVTTIGLERSSIQVEILGEPIDVVMWDPAG